LSTVRRLAWTDGYDNVYASRTIVGLLYMTGSVFLYGQKIRTRTNSTNKIRKLSKKLLA